MNAPRGLMLVEMMVSILIGAVIVLVASALLVGANRDYLHHSASVRMNDGGRYALAVLGQAVRQAALINWDAEAAPMAAMDDASANVSGLDARSVRRNADGIAAPLADAVNGSDVLALRYAGSGAGGGDGSVLNCAGFGVGVAHTEQERGWSIFYVALGSDGEAELRCKYRGENGWGADAIVRGVDSFQVLYGVDTDAAPDGVANRYLNASAIAALDAALPLAGDGAAAQMRDLNRRTHWKRVTSIKVALLLHGEAHTGPQADSATYDLFGSAYAEAAQGRDPGVRIQEGRLPPDLKARARRVFSTSIALRNGGA